MTFFVEIILWLAAALLAAIVVFVPHYFAHAYAAYKCGDYTPKAYGRVTLNPMKHFDVLGFIMLALVGFGWGKPLEVNPSNFRHYKRGLVTYGIAGMITNFVVAIFCYALYALVVAYMKSSYLEYFLYTLFWLMYSRSMYFFVINLLPFPPLDGFIVVEAATKPWNKFREFCAKYGQTIFLALIIECFACRILSEFLPVINYANVLGYIGYFATDYVGWPIMKLWSLVIPI